MIFDTHVHYNLSPLVDDWKNHWEQAQQYGVTKSTVVATDFFSSIKAIEIAEQDQNLFATIGNHPTNYSDPKKIEKWIKTGGFIEEQFKEEIEIDIEELQLLLDDKKVVAVGEIGLDYYRFNTVNKQETIEIARTAQKYAFSAQFQLAVKNQLPVIIHCRDRETPENYQHHNAYWDLLSILKEEHQKLSHTTQNTLPPIVFHCASGPIQFIKEAIDLGVWIGVDGNVTYKNATLIREIVQICPQNKLLLETDAPYLPPQPYRGKTCYPWMISVTASYLEETFQIPQDQLYQNAENFFFQTNQTT